MADNKDKKVFKSSIEREQSQTCLNSAEREKIKGSTNLNVPHLRFPEFSGEWEETTLGKISEITKGSGISKDNYLNKALLAYCMVNFTPSTSLKLLVWYIAEQSWNHHRWLKVRLMMS